MTGSYFTLAWAVTSVVRIVTSLDVYQSNSGPITSVILDKSGNVLVAGRNRIFQFSNENLAEKNLEYQLDTSCLNGLSCGATNITNNDVSILSTYTLYGKGYVLFCGTEDAYCYGLRSDNITSYSKLSGTTAGSKLSAYVVIQNDPENSRSVVYSAMNVATENTDHYTFSKKAIYDTQYVDSSVVLTDLSDEKFIKATDDQYLQFIYGFSEDGFVYFVRNNQTHTTTAYISQLCEEDLYFKSYVEIKLSCGDYAVAESAYLYKSASVTLLVATFSSTKHPGSALCVFNVRTLYEEFKAAKQRCFNEYSGSWPNWIKRPSDKSNAQSCKPPVNTNSHWLCGGVLNGLNHSRIQATGIIQNPPIRIDVRAIMTSSALTSTINKFVIYVGTSKGVIEQVLFDKAFSQSIAGFSVPTGDDLPIRRAMVLNEARNGLYFTYGDKVALLRTDDCSLYSTCQGCLAGVVSCQWVANSTQHGECMSRNQIVDDFRLSVYTDHCLPAISEMTPLAGPTAGGTKLTISGQFSALLASKSRLLISVGQGNTCDITMKMNESITCVTSDVATDTMEVEVTMAAEKLDSVISDPFFIDVYGNVSYGKLFSYQTPTVEVDGPLIHVSLAGGVQIQLNGTDLDIGSERKVLIGGKECPIKELDNITDTSITCRAPGMDNNESYSVQVKIDGAVIKGPVIRYIENPVFESVSPFSAIESGGVTLYLGGRNLQGLGETIYIEFMDQSGASLNSEPGTCTFHLDEYACLTGPINSSFLSKPLPVESSIQITNFYQDLELAVIDRNTFPNQIFTIVKDPDLFPLERNFFFTAKESVLTLKGRQLSNVDKEEVIIYVGTLRCNIRTFADDVIRCRFKMTDHVTDVNGIFPIKAVIGYRDYWLGNAVYQNATLASPISQEPGNQEPGYMQATIGIGLGVGVLAAIGIACGVVQYRKRQKYLLAQNNPYTASFSRNGDFITLDGLSESHATDAEQNQQNIYQEQTFVKGANESEATSDTEPLLLDDNTRLLLERQNLLIDRNCLVMAEVLGQGHFGCVYKCFYRLPDEKEEKIVAAKTLHRPNPKDLDVQMFLKEALIMKDFCHNNVMELLGICLGMDKLPLVILPYMQAGDLLTYLRDGKNSPRVSDLVVFGMDIANGMYYLSQLKFVHRDLAARNCMLTDDLKVKIADFGLSRDVYEKEYYSSNDKTAKLPIKWMSPESLEFRVFSSKSDVWSYGVVLWELLTRGMTPYPTVDNWEILKYLKEGRRMSKPDHCPSKVYKIMLRCWEWNQDDRPTFGDITIELPEILRK